METIKGKFDVKSMNYLEMKSGYRKRTVVCNYGMRSVIAGSAGQEDELVKAVFLFPNNTKEN